MNLIIILDFNLNIISLIPARMGSSRFPGKPMKKILGIPMIEHVYRRVVLSKKLSKVAVATCDDEIFNHITNIGGLAIMTGKHHERASDRCAEALQIFEKKIKKKFEIIGMLQGDEPLISSKIIDDCFKKMDKNKEILITNAISKIHSNQELKDKNCIKVVFDNDLYALYFSRSIIPFTKKNFSTHFKQVCIINFRRKMLLKILVN